LELAIERLPRRRAARPFPGDKLAKKRFLPPLLQETLGRE
jgi:hypothetical protein